MSLFSEFENKMKNTDSHYIDPFLGRMSYNQEDGTWFGRFRQYDYRIAAELSGAPEKSLLWYGKQVFNDIEGLEQVLREQKRRKLGCYGGLFDDELLRLRFLNLMFFYRGNARRILAQLVPDGLVDTSIAPVRCDNHGGGLFESFGDSEQRLWRLEFEEDQCLMLDFDY